MAATIQADLGPKLSTKATILLPSDADFERLIESKPQAQASPQVVAVVRVFNESDVQETVRYANQHGHPFVARFGGVGEQGQVASTGDKEGAIQIDFRTIDHIEVAPEGTSVTLGAGVTVEKLIDELSAAGKETVTSPYKTAGITIPILSGGHGLLQGKYGLPCDQAIYARMVLPDGEAVTVSEESNPDLFWGLKGAGHKFGLVVEWEYRIYEKENPKWSFEEFYFAGDKLEKFFSLVNDMTKKQPREVTHWISIVMRVPGFDPDHPIIRCAILYDGPLDAAQSYAKPFHAIGPLHTTAGTAATANDLSSDDILTGTLHTPPNGDKYVKHSHPVYLNSYDLTALRKLYDDMDQQPPSWAEGGGGGLAPFNFTIRGYPPAAEAAATAPPKNDNKTSNTTINNTTAYFPHRSTPILASSSSSSSCVPGIMSSSSSSPETLVCSKRLRGYLQTGENSVVSEEGKEEDPSAVAGTVIYKRGEEWREAKLREVMGVWDPEKRMGGGGVGSVV